MKAKISRILAKALSNEKTSKKLGKALVYGEYGKNIEIEGKNYKLKKFNLDEIRTK